MPMNNRLLRPISRIVASVGAFVLRTIAGAIITTISGEPIRTIQDA